MWNFHSIWWPGGYGCVQESRDSLTATGWNLDWSQCLLCMTWEGVSLQPLHCGHGCIWPWSFASPWKVPRTAGVCPGADCTCESPEEADQCSSCFVYHNEDCSVGREASLLPIQEFHKRGALMFLVMGKPQNVGWSEGTVQVILQKSCPYLLGKPELHENLFSLEGFYLQHLDMWWLQGVTQVSLTTTPPGTWKRSEPRGDPGYCSLRNMPKLGGKWGWSGLGAITVTVAVPCRPFVFLPSAHPWQWVCSDKHWPHVPE